MRNDYSTHNFKQVRLLGCYAINLKPTALQTLSQNCFLEISDALSVIHARLVLTETNGELSVTFNSTPPALNKSIAQPRAGSIARHSKF